MLFNKNLWISKFIVNCFDFIDISVKCDYMRIKYNNKQDIPGVTIHKSFI